MPVVLEAAFKSLKRGGTCVVMGLPHPSLTVRFSALSFAGEGKTLMGSYMGSSDPQNDIPRYLALWKAGRLPVEKLHTGSLPLSKINEAFERLACCALGATDEDVLLRREAVRLSHPKNSFQTSRQICQLTPSSYASRAIPTANRM